MSLSIRQAAALLLAVSTTTAAADLASIPFSVDGLLNTTASQTGAQFIVELDSHQLFENYSFGSATAGATLNADSTSDADFASFAASITDGLNHQLIFRVFAQPSGLASF